MKKNGFWGRFFMALMFLFLYAPIFVLIVFSFNATKSRSVWAGFSVKWYVSLFSDEVIMDALRTTLLVSVIASFVACIAGTAAALGIYAMKRKTRSAVMSVNNIPLTNADIVTGVSLSLLFVFAINAFNATIGKSTGSQWSLGFTTLLIAHITFDIPYVILSVLPKLRQLGPNIYEAAQDLGATGAVAFRKVILPDLMPGIINGLLIAFTMSIDDFVISYFTAGSQVSTLSMEVYAMARRKISPEINAVSTIMFGSVLLLLVIINLRETHQSWKLKQQQSRLNPKR